MPVAGELSTQRIPDNSVILSLHGLYSVDVDLFTIQSESIPVHRNGKVIIEF